MRSIFEEDSYNELMERLNNLTPDHKPKWGRMNVEKMLVHTRKAIELAMGDIIINQSNFIVRFLAGFFKSFLYNDLPYIKGLPTARVFIIKDYEDFDTEIDRLRKKIHRMHTHEKFFFPYTAHPIFGRLEPYMWGQSAYKHLDHHFKQFGI